MCGRFALYSDPQTLARHFGAEAPTDLRPRYNVAPTQTIPIVRQAGQGRQFALARWGLIPHWAKALETGYSTINARRNRGREARVPVCFSSPARHRTGRRVL